MHQPLEDVRKAEVTNTLRSALTATFNFYFCAHSYHWNVVGPDFSQLHELFGDIYADAHQAVDDLAERLRTLDEMAPRSLKELSGASDVDASAENAAEMIDELENENALLIAALNDACTAAVKAGKAGLSNFLQDRIDKHAKWGWMLRATAR